MQPLRTLVFANSVDYARHTGGWVYNSRLMRELAARGWKVVALDLPAGFPRPDQAAIERSTELLAALDDATLVLADQICLSPLAAVAEREAERLRLVLIFHHPIAREEDLGAAERAHFAALESRALAACHAVITTSPSTAASLVADYAVAPNRIIVAPPGLDRRSVTEPPPLDAMPRLLSVGAVIARKGYHVLVDALAPLRTLPWRFDIVGDLDRSPAYADELQAQIAAAGLAERVMLCGGLETEELEALWGAAHVYVAASYHEGYGMAIAEAIARGLPTVTTRAGAVGDWLDPNAAIIVPDGDAAALRNALTRVIADPELRAVLRAAALDQADGFHGWADTADAVSQRLASS